MADTRACLSSPLGPVAVRFADAAPDAALLALRFCRAPDQPRAAAEAPGAPLVPAQRLQEQLDAYFAGALRAFTVPLQLCGSPFEQRVWAALREIRYGQTATYGDIAREVGQPGAARAVGRANGANPVWLIVPCHRIIRSDGQPGGYGGGVERKRALLALERQSIAAAPAAPASSTTAASR